MEAWKSRGFLSVILFGKLYKFQNIDNNMKNIEDKVKGAKPAKETLKDFYRMMELIKQYPVKPIYIPKPSPPWRIPRPY